MLKEFLKYFGGFYQEITDPVAFARKINRSAQYQKYLAKGGSKVNHMKGVTLSFLGCNCAGVEEPQATPEAVALMLGKFTKNRDGWKNLDSVKIEKAKGFFGWKQDGVRLLKRVYENYSPYEANRRVIPAGFEKKTVKID